MSVPVLTQWVANGIVVLFFPYVSARLGQGVSFLFFGVVAVAQLLFTWRFIPETKGKTLEEIESLWDRPVSR
jgi:SP family arabinose:H+ symporter-like MFS transporter